jgi:hypothetical protein
MLLGVLRRSHDHTAVMLLSTCFEHGYSDDEANFVCRHLSEEISFWDDTDDEKSEFILCIIHALLALSNEPRGRALIIRSGIVNRLAQNSTISSGNLNKPWANQAYHNAERTHWHNIWKISNKLLCSLLSQIPASHEERPEDVDLLLYAQAAEYITSHQERLSFSLAKALQQRPLTMALIEEVEIVSMLMRCAPARSVSELKDDICMGIVRVNEALRKSQLILSKVTPITHQERKNFDKNAPEISLIEFQKLRRESSSHVTPVHHRPIGADTRKAEKETIESVFSTRGTLSWNIQIDLIVYSTLRCLLATMRILSKHHTLIPTTREKFRPSMINTIDTTLTFYTLVQCIDLGVDSLKLLSSPKYRSTSLLSVSATSSTSTPKSSGSAISSPSAFHDDEAAELTSFDESAKKLQQFLNSRVLLTRVITGVLNNCLHIAVQYMRNEIATEWHSEFNLYINKAIKDLEDCMKSTHSVYNRFKDLGRVVKGLKELMLMAVTWSEHRLSEIKKK